MADKKISNLTRTTTVNNADLLVLQQSGLAKSITGQNFVQQLLSLLEQNGGIVSIEKTGTSGLVDTYTITYVNGTNSSFTVTNGNGIVSITGPVSSGLQDTYTITYDDGTTRNIVITNGQNGTDGEDGRGIASFTGPVVVGDVATYTITYTDGTTSELSVRNGSDGEDGEDGRGIASFTGPVVVGDVATYTITYTDGTTSELSVRYGRGISSISWSESGTAGDGRQHLGTITYTDGTTSEILITDGVKGDSWYTYVKWADEEPTSDEDLLDEPSVWIGIYWGSEAEEDLSYSDYSWYEYKGSKGDKGDTGDSITLDGENTSTMYQISADGSNVPQGAWTSTIPEPVAGSYLWVRTHVALSSGDSFEYYSVSRYGRDGSGSGTVNSVNNIEPASGTGDVQITGSDIPLNDTGGQVDTLADAIDAIDGRVDALEASSTGIESAITELQGDVDDINDYCDAISASLTDDELVISGLQTSVGALDTAVDSLEDDFNTIQSHAFDDVIAITDGGTGADSAVGAMTNLAASIQRPSEEEPFDDEDDLLVSDVDNEQNRMQKRPLAWLWNYIQDKIEDVLGLTDSEYDGSAAEVNGHSVEADVPANAVFTDTTNLASMTGVLGASNGGTGESSLSNSMNAFINALQIGTSNPTDDDYMITQYVGGNAGDAPNTTYYRRSISKFWAYIKGKIIDTANGLVPWSVARGGTGATTAAGARANIGLGTAAEITAISRQRGEAIPANSDLNDYTTPGDYYIQNGTIGATIENTPYTSGCRIFVFTGGTTAIVSQILLASGNARQMVYTRRYYTVEGWTAWNKLVDDKELYFKPGDSITYTTSSASTSYTTLAAGARSSGIINLSVPLNKRLDSAITSVSITGRIIIFGGGSYHEVIFDDPDDPDAVVVATGLLAPYNGVTIRIQWRQNVPSWFQTNSVFLAQLYGTTIKFNG